MEKMHQAFAVLLQVATQRSKRFGNYLKAYLIEIAEIAVQLDGDLPLATYKIDKQKKTSALVWQSIKGMLKKFVRFPKGPTPPGIFKKDIRVIFVVEFINHLKEFSAIYKKLVEDDVPFLVIFVNDDIYHKHGATYKNAVLLNKDRSIGQQVRSSMQFMRLNLNILTNKNIKVVSKGKRSRFLAALFHFNVKYLLDTIVLSENFLKIVDRLPRVPLVFFKSEGFRTRSLIIAAKEIGFKTVSIQHGLILTEPKYAYLPTDQYIVWSDIFKKHLEQSKAGCNIIALGRPSSDHEFLDRPSTMNDFSNRAMNILFLPNTGSSQTPLTEVIWATRLCLQYKDENPYVNLSIKPHPGDRSDNIKKVVDELKMADKVDLIPAGNKISYLDYDIIATMNSTSGIEAAFYGRPILLLLSDINLLMVKEYLEFNVGLWVDTLEAMKMSVANIKNRYSEYQAYAQIFAHAILFNQGNASKNIVEFILNKPYER